MLPIPKATAQRTLPPAGTHFAHVYQMIHIGTVAGAYQGVPNKRNKVRIGFELTEEKHVFKEGDEAKPFVIAGSYTLSLGEKSSLRPLVEGIIGKALSEQEAENFDLESILGKACLVSVVHKETPNGIYANIASTTPLIKGMAISPQINPTFILNYEDKWSGEAFDKLPQFIKEEMQESDEFKEKYEQHLKKVASTTSPDENGRVIDTSDSPF